MARWVLYAVVLLTLGGIPVLASLYPENWVTYSILLGLLALVFFLYLLARRTLVDFKKGMKEGQRRG